MNQNEKQIIWIHLDSKESEKSLRLAVWQRPAAFQVTEARRHDGLCSCSERLSPHGFDELDPTSCRSCLMSSLVPCLFTALATFGLLRCSKSCRVTPATSHILTMSYVPVSIYIIPLQALLRFLPMPSGPVSRLCVQIWFWSALVHSQKKSRTASSA